VNEIKDNKKEEENSEIHLNDSKKNKKKRD
jgi:hypothetical protein